MATYDIEWCEDRARDFFRDPNAAFITQDSVFAWLNYAFRDLAWRQRILHDTASSTTSGNTITLPSDFVDLVYLSLDDDDKADQVKIVDDDVWNSWEEVDGDPAVYFGRIFEGVIEIYPTPETGTSYTLRYIKEPSDLTTGQTSTLPKPLIWKAIFYATAQGFYHLGKNAEGDRYVAQYEQGLRGQDLLGPNSQAGPITLHVPGGYFDSTEYLD